jgi:hypothetical protein
MAMILVGKAFKAVRSRKEKNKRNCGTGNKTPYFSLERSKKSL